MFLPNNKILCRASGHFFPKMRLWRTDVNWVQGMNNCMYICLCSMIIHTVYPKKYAHGFALLCFVVVIHWLIFPYPSGLLHWHYGNLTIAPVPAKQPWWIWINTSCELIMNDCITTTKQSTTKPCAYFLGYTVHGLPSTVIELYCIRGHGVIELWYLFM